MKKKLHWIGRMGRKLRRGDKVRLLRRGVKKKNLTLTSKQKKKNSISGQRVGRYIF